MSYTSPRLKKVIAVSEGVKRELRQYYGLPEDRFTVIPNGVDHTVFKPAANAEAKRKLRQELKLPLDAFTGLFVGGDWDRKGLADAIHAVARVPEAVLVVVRRGDETRFDEIAVQAGAQDRVLFCGTSTRPQDYYAAADVFVFPRRYEAFSLATLEAAAAGWLACGQSIVETMLPRGYGRKPHRVLPLGVDVQEFYPNRLSRQRVRQSLNWDETGPPVVGYLGRFVTEKGIEVLMRALDETPSSWRALIVGGGPLESQLRQWAARYGDRVRIVTGVVHDQVPAYLNAMDMLVAPSQTTPRWREQLGRMLLEAFACGVPVIASNSGEIPYVVSDAGIIVDEQNQAGWTQAIARMLEDATLRDELAARGRERAQTVYAWPLIARQHLEFFSERLETKQPTESSEFTLQRVGFSGSTLKREL